MIDAIKILFGMAAAGILGGLMFHFMKKPEPARRMFLIGVPALVLAVVLEIYVRFIR